MTKISKKGIWIILYVLNILVEAHNHTPDQQTEKGVKSFADEEAVRAVQCGSFLLEQLRRGHFECHECAAASTRAIVLSVLMSRLFFFFKVTWLPFLMLSCQNIMTVLIYSM